jgi:ubiquinone/menaquinone biosynthesis C-methylase UbiE
MIPRTLEPEAMDTPEEALEYDAMDHAEVNARFAADFLTAHGPCRGGPILDVGTGTARIPIEVAQRDPLARLVAADLSGPMLEIAERNVQAAGLGGRVTPIRVDAKGFADPDGSYEAVISNSIVHHIPEPRIALAEMARLVAPGGTLFCRDLTRPASEAEVEQLVARYTVGETGPGRDLFAASLRAALTLVEIQDIVGSLGLPRDGVTMTSDRHWTWVWRTPSHSRASS